MTNWLPWTYDEWGHRYPSMHTDEYFRHTLVIPNPFKMSSIDDDGTVYYPAVVIPFAPWWACRHIFSAEYREDAREGREQSRCSDLASAELKRLHPDLWSITQTPYGNHTEEEVSDAWDIYFEISDRYEEERRPRSDDSD